MKTTKLFLTAIILLVCQVVISAPAPPPSGGTTGSPACWPPPCVPVDNGILFLIAAGAIYGAKKIYDLRKKAQPLS